MKIDWTNFLKKEFPNGRFFKGHNGDELRINCISKDCPQPKDHMFVNLSSNNPKHDKMFICHRCGIQGNHKAFLVIYYGLPYKQIIENYEHILAKDEDPYLSARKQASNIVKIKDFWKFDFSEDIEEECIIELPKGFRELQVRTKFCINRKIPLSIIKHFKVGVCESGYYKSRLIIPIETKKNRSFFAYSQNTKKSLRIYKILAERYKNSKRMQTSKKKILYPAGTMMSILLFNYNHIKKNERIIFVHEGFTDCVRTILHGFHPVAIGSNRISKTQSQLLSEKEPEEICLMLDSDVSQSIINSNLKTISEECDSKITYVRLMSGDPDDILTRQKFLEIIARRRSYPTQISFNFNKGGLLF